MELPSQVKKQSDDTLLIIVSQLRENYGKVVYSHKAHEKCADIYFKRGSRIKVWQILLSAITTGSLVATLLGDSKVGTIVAVIVSTSLLALNAYTKDYNIGELAQKHVDTASRLWEIRESYLSLLTDIATGDVSIIEARQKRDALQEALASIYQTAPRTTSKAYAEAQKALKINEDLTFSDEEIDKFLPTPLRRT